MAKELFSAEKIKTYQLTQKWPRIVKVILFLVPSYHGFSPSFLSETTDQKITEVVAHQRWGGRSEEESPKFEQIGQIESFWQVPGGG